MTPTRKKELIARLLKAIEHYRANKPRLTTRQHSDDLALRFGVNKRTMWTALRLEGKGELCQQK